LISGIAVYVNTYLVVQSDDATVYTTAKNGIAALILLSMMVAAVRRRPQRAHRLTRTQWAGLAALGLVGGSIPFVLFFEGLARAGSATTGGFIHKTLVVWVAALAVLLLRERLTIYHLGAIALLVVGQATLVDLSGFGIGSGELMIFGATLLWAVEFVVAKRLLASVRPLVVGSARLGIGIVLLVAFVAATGRAGDLASLSAEQWAWAGLTGGILAAFVATWYAALARAQAVDVTTVLVFRQIITLLVAAGAEGVPIATNVSGLVLIALGVGAATFGALQARPGPATA
jgi:drug/metabolite transporter (DMT)-like permease